MIRILLIICRSFLSSERQPQGHEHFSVFFDALKTHIEDISTLRGRPGSLALAKVALTTSEITSLLPQTPEIAACIESGRLATLKLLDQEINSMSSGSSMPIRGPGQGNLTSLLDLLAGFNDMHLRETLSESGKSSSCMLQLLSILTGVQASSYYMPAMPEFLISLSGIMSPI
jgi:hypothetical protein